MTRLLPALALALALILWACGPPPLTQDRLGPEQLQAMVAEPLGIAEKGDLPRAQEAFEALLARSDPEQASDLLTAFGVGLYMFDPGDDEDALRLRRAALPYLERAIPAAAARFGARHPEVALALHTYGGALRNISAGDPPRAVDRALAQAFLIRTRALGPDNRETIAALRAYAEVMGLPSRTRGEPERIERVGRMYEDVIRALEARPDPGSMHPEQVRSAQLEMFVRNGRVARALEVARSVDSRKDDWNRSCEVGPRRWMLAEVLVKAGRKDAARAVVRTHSPQWPECRLDEAMLGLDI